MTKRALIISKISLAAMFLAICWLIPSLTGRVPELGRVFLLMHIPVMICGFVLGPVYGAFIGFVAPLTNTLFFVTPPITSSVPMAFELAVYGSVVGFLFAIFVKKFKKLDSIIFIYISLVIAMILGRAVGGIVSYIYNVASGNEYTAIAYWTGYFAQGWPGMIIQIVLIPSIIRLLYGQNIIQKFLPDYKFVSKGEETVKKEENNQVNKVENN